MLQVNEVGTAPGPVTAGPFVPPRAVRCKVGKYPEEWPFGTVGGCQADQAVPAALRTEPSGNPHCDPGILGQGLRGPDHAVEREQMRNKSRG